MSFCNKCGSGVEPNVKFCPKCGNKLEVNEFATAPYQEVNPIINANSTINTAQANIKVKKDRTRFWLIMKLVVFAMFILLLFLPGMININTIQHDYTYDPEIFEEYDSNLSFADYSHHRFYTPYNDFSSPSEVQIIIAFIIVAFLILEIVFSFIRIVKFKFVKINKRQLILPILIFLLFITSCVSFYFDSYHENERFTYEFTDTDYFTGKTEKWTNTYSQSFYDNTGFTEMKPPSSSSSAIAKLIYSVIYSYSFGPLFYIAIAVFIIMLAIDCYSIKKVKLLQKTLQ